MRPVRVKMSGFGTFRDETVVDFTDVDLLAFVGGTGSGKSTIIDAMTFALFGRIARLDANAVAPVINAISTEARIVFEFELAGSTYTAARLVRRTATGATTKEARLECGDDVLANGRGEMGIEVERLLGLDFDRFTRVVMLPQGKFAAFLHDTPRARQQLLRSLLDLGLYERLGKRARQIVETATSQLEVLRPRLEEPGVSDDDIAALEADLGRIRSTKAGVDSALAERKEAVDTLDRLCTEAEGLGVLVLAVASVDVPPDVIALGDRMAAASAARAAAVEALGVATEDEKVATTAVADGPNRAQCERLLERYAELHAAVDVAADLEVALASARAENDRAEAAAAALAARLERAEQAVLAAEATDAAAAQALAGGPSRAEIDRQRELLDRLTRQEVDLDTARSAVTEATATVEAARAACAAAELDHGAVVAKLRQAEADGHAEVLAGMLVAGEPCPVCRQVVDEVPGHFPSPAISDARLEEKAARVTFDEARNRLGTVETALAVAAAHAEQLAATIDADRARAAPGPDRDQLDALVAELQRLETAAEKAKKERESLARAARELRESGEAKATRADAASAASALVTTAAKLDATRQREEELRASLDGQPAPGELEAMLVEANRRAGDHAAAVAARKLAEQRCEHAAAEVEGFVATEATLRHEFTARRDRFVGIGPPSPVNTSLLDDWLAFATWAHGLQAPLEAEHETAAERVTTASAELEQSDAALRAEVLCDEGASSCEIERLGDFYVELVARTAARLEAAQAQREKLESDRKQVEILDERREVHEVLGNRLLRSSGFEQWVMQEVVEALVERATERLFTLSGGQYSIEAESMEFWIRDHRNGDELRDARTLSGGETFLASLALALALADSLHDLAPQGSPPLESLFLDEGFGTLDPETLDVVAAAIEELGASGRMVGVITHIRDLAERMPVRFEVAKGAATSTVERADT